VTLSQEMATLRGLKIVRVRLNKWTDERGAHYDPEILLSNGKSLVFLTTETNNGDGYGVMPIVRERWRTK
jgi:hypothetical protein